MSEQVYNRLISLYQKYGSNKYMINEPITQSMHVLEAAYIAKICGAPNWVVISMLVHDIGQLLGLEEQDSKVEKDINYLHANHNQLGADWLKSNGFPDTICDWVKYHTMVKILWCEEDKNYYGNLSQASKDSYHIQKEKYLGTYEYQKLLKHPYLEDFKNMRLIDDMSKIPLNKNFKYFDFKIYYSCMQKVLSQNYYCQKNSDWHINIMNLHNKNEKYCIENVIVSDK